MQSLERSRIDLHIHSTASDGRWTPEELVEQVQREGIGCFAVADHDTVGNVLHVEALAQERGLAFLRGAELSSKLNGRLMHILAYGFELDHEFFGELVHANEKLMDAYNDSLVQVLIDTGYELDYSDYLDYSWDRRRGGWKSLNYLIDQGLCRDVRSFFDELFVGDLEVVFPDFPRPDTIVEAINAAGGVAVWAHPANSLSKKASYSPQDDEAVVAQMVEAGIQGLECFTCHHDAAWTERCLDWASHYDLLVTGGSDSHGGFVGRQLGQPVIHAYQLRLGPLWDRLVF